MARVARFPQLTINKSFAVDLVACFLIGSVFAIGSGVSFSALLFALAALIAHFANVRRFTLFHFRQTSDLSQ